MSRDRFESIIRKWSDSKIPGHIKELMKFTREPVEAFLSDFTKLKRKADNLSIQESADLARMVGDSLGLMGWTNFMLGLEFADEFKEVEQSFHESRPQPNNDTVSLELDFEEWGVLDACVEASKQMILKKTKLAKIALNRQESDVVDRIEDLQKVVSGAGEETFRKIPKIKLHSKSEQMMAFNQLLISTYAGVEDAVLEWQIERLKGEGS